MKRKVGSLWMQAGKRKKNGVKLGGGARNHCKFDYDHFLVLIVTNVPTCRYIYVHVGACVSATIDLASYSCH